LKREFGGLVATTWKVLDDEASEVVKQLVKLSYKEGVPIAEALRQIRSERGGSSSTSLAYLYYGDVMAGFRKARVKKLRKVGA